MSISVMSQVWRDDSIQDQGQLLLLLALADFSDDDGLSWPSIPKLAQKIRHAERAVYYLLSKLKESGHLTVDSGGGRHQTNSYRITLQPLQGLQRNPAIHDIKPCNPRHKTLHPIAPQPSVPVIEPPVHRASANGFAEHPDLKEVLFHADRIGLAHWKAEDWFNEMEGCGWLDHASRPVARWQSIMARVKAKWEADGRPTGPPGRKSNPGSVEPSVFEIKTAMQAKETRATALKNRHCSETASGPSWGDKEAAKEYFALRKEIAALNNRLSNSVSV